MKARRTRLIHPWSPQPEPTVAGQAPKYKPSDRIRKALARPKWRAEQQRWRAANPERAREIVRATWERHGEKYRAHKRQRWSDNRGYREQQLLAMAVYRQDHREQSRAYYAANREKMLAKDAEYRAAHREEIRAKDRAWREANLEEVRRKNRERMARWYNSLTPEQRAAHNAHQKESRLAKKARQQREDGAA